MEISQGMKIHQYQFARGLIWDHEPPSLTLGCKRFRPLAPKIATTTTTTTAATFDLKSFIRPEISTGSRKIGSSSDYQKKESTQVDQAAQPAGGTRWNPTQEQIGILEMLYRSGMRTPNAKQIEQITVQLAKYGKIEGKNVFYWFQNHKARERQKQKRNNTSSTTLGFIHSPRTPPSPLSTVTSLMLSPTKGNGVEEDQNSPCKRKCRSWAIDECSEEDRNISYCTEDQEEEEVGKDRTLKLFPLHPEGRS